LLAQTRARRAFFALWTTEQRQALVVFLAIIGCKSRRADGVHRGDTAAAHCAGESCALSIGSNVATG